jgi:hypothetical protein
VRARPCPSLESFSSCPGTGGGRGHDARNGVKKSDECSRRMAGLMKLAERYGVKVKESSVGSIGFVGGVRRPEAKSTDNGKDDSSGPTIN